ncbi:MAG: anthranilate phosphoribosyltransferase [Gemmatimonadales bacterium]
MDPPIEHPTPLARAITQLADGQHLTAEACGAAFDELMAGSATPSQIAALLVGLRVLGETDEEIAGAATALRRAMVTLPGVADRDDLVDTCGTGGGSVPTFNISTAAALVAAGAGVPVAKHGNRSFTSRSGSADVFEALGVAIDIAPERAVRALDHAGIMFLFAPNFHPALRHAGPVRRELGIPTVMNLLGPLGNPAGARRQVVGVADRSKAPVLARALARLGAVHALVVHGEVGMDEVSPTGPTSVWEVRAGEVHEWTVEPEALGVGAIDLKELMGGSPAENADRVEQLLRGADDPAGRAAVLLNAAAAIYVSEGRRSFGEALALAGRALDEGQGADRLDRLRTSA